MFNLLESLLTKYGDEVLKVARKTLKDLGKIASGKLFKSLNYKINSSATSTQIKFGGIEYLNEVEEGRAAGQEAPPTGKIMQWMQYKNIEGKNSKSAAFLIARSIGKNGIEPTHFMRNAIITTNDKFKKSLTKEMQQYFIKDIKKVIQK